MIEAQNEDLERGFGQPAIALTALEQGLDTDHPIPYGAISTGNIWQFGQFHRQSHQVIQGLNLNRVPVDLEELLRILVQRLAP